MSMKEILEKDLLDALRAGNDLKKRTIRMIIASIKFAQVEKGSPLDDPNIMVLIQKEIKNRRDAIQEAQKANRYDLIDENLSEIALLEEYLPKQLSEAEIVELARQAIQEAEAKGPADMGKVMKLLMPRTQGKAAGNLVSSVVQRLLQE